MKRAGDKWYGDVFGLEPVQGLGRIDGYPWYFRGRHGEWSFEIADDQALDEQTPAVVAIDVPGWRVWGFHREAGSMAEDEAWQIIEAQFEAFRKRTLAYITPAEPRPDPCTPEKP